MPTGKLSEIFDIPELFSAILIHLPILDLLLRAPLVNHSWKYSIERSPSVQSKLFFHPKQYNASRKPEINPLLQAAFRPWFHNRPIEYRYPSLIFKYLDWSRTYTKIAAYARKEASWRRMLPVQPPCKILEVVKLTHWEDEHFENRGEVRFEDGVRMGTLYDLVYQILTERDSFFWISWPMFPDLDCQDLGWVCCNGEEDVDDEFGYDTPIQRERITFTESYVEYDEDVVRNHVPGSEFRSEGYGKLDIILEEARLLAWDRHTEEFWNYDPNKYGI